jgi:citrate synthase
MKDKEEAELIIGNAKYTLPIKKSTIGPDVIDISNLYNESGYFTYDPAFMSTAACTSSITFIDGEKGILKHRGYDIKDLALNCEFLEIAYLLLEDDLPNKDQYKDFKESIFHHSLVNEQLRNLFNAFRYSAHPMAITLSAIGSLSALYYDSLGINSDKDRDIAAIRIIAKMPTIAAMSYKFSIGQPFIYPKNNLGFVENFLHMMFSTPCEEYKVPEIFAKALNKIMILHADHEQNASTSSVRIVGSTGAHPFACIGAGIASLWGPSHGGANEAVINMLHEIGSIDKIPYYINRAKDKNDPFKLMGFGHRVYKNYDPRAEILRKTCAEILTELGQIDNPILKIAIELETIALSDNYFIERKLYPNVDFYSGIIYEIMGIPPKMFTVMFAVARTAGWIAQWKEMISDSTNKISRPRQLYSGYPERSFIDIKGRF